MGLAGSGAAYRHDIVCATDKLVSMESFDQGFVHFARFKVEPAQILVCWEPCCFDLIGDGPGLAFGHLGVEQFQQDRHGGREGRYALFDQFTDGFSS